MARNKETLILLVDVGPSMHSVLPEVENVCSMLVQKKFIFGKSDDVGIVLFGTEGTNNELAKEVGGYYYVSVFRDIKVVDEDAVEVLQNLPRGTSPGDFLDAIVVGMDMIIKKYPSSDKRKKNVYLISNVKHPTKEPNVGTKEDQVDTMSQLMQDHGICLNSIIVREKNSGPESLSVVDENNKLLDQFSRKAIAKTEHVDSTISLLGAMKTRNINPVTVFRGDMEISSTMKIKVWVYKKTSEEKFPTLKKFSDKAHPSDEFATHEVKVDFEYKSMESDGKVVPPEQRIKGYRYGPQVVPISATELDAVKFKSEKGVKLLGFTDASNILRQYYTKDVYIFMPEPGNEKATVAVSAIARAMKEMNKHAIIRCVWRQGQGNVVLGVLTPNLSSLNNIPDSFFFNVLPFAEDIREMQFPSFSSLSSSMLPNEQQQAAADNFVRALDLSSSDRKEVLQPDYTPNPILERFYRFLDLRSKNPEADVPQLNRSLKQIVEPDPDILSCHKSVIDNFKKLFELKENPKKRRSTKGVSSYEPSASNEKEVGVGGEVPKVGDLNPVQDFEAMMAHRDSAKWISKAIKEMQSHIIHLLENSLEGDTYPKAIECLIALRKGCILEQEPKEFNEFLIRIHKKWHNTDLADFFVLLPPKNIAPISKSEAADSDLTDEEAKNFQVKYEHSLE